MSLELTEIKYSADLTEVEKLSNVCWVCPVVLRLISVEVEFSDIIPTTCRRHMIDNAWVERVVRQACQCQGCVETFVKPVPVRPICFGC